MKNINIKIIFLLVGISIANLGGLFYQSSTFDRRVENTIVNNPKMIVKAVKKLKLQRAEKPTASENELSRSFKNFVYDIKFPSSGASLADEDIVIYEWMDYQCGYCKATYKILDNISKSDPKIAIKYIDYPILGKVSTLASYVALSAEKQGKYNQFHRQLMMHKGKLSKDIIYQKAIIIGLDMEQVRADIKSTEIKTTINRNLKLGKSVGATGTPFMIFYGKKNSQIVGGYVNENRIKKLIEDLR